MTSGREGGTVSDLGKERVSFTSAWCQIWSRNRVKFSKMGCARGRLRKGCLLPQLKALASMLSQRRRRWQALRARSGKEGEEDGREIWGQPDFEDPAGLLSVRSALPLLGRSPLPWPWQDSADMEQPQSAPYRRGLGGAAQVASGLASIRFVVRHSGQQSQAAGRVQSSLRKRSHPHLNSCPRFLQLIQWCLFSPAHCFRHALGHQLLCSCSSPTSNAQPFSIPDAASRDHQLEKCSGLGRSDV